MEFFEFSRNDVRLLALANCQCEEDPARTWMSRIHSFEDLQCIEKVVCSVVVLTSASSKSSKTILDISLADPIGGERGGQFVLGLFKKRAGFIRLALVLKRNPGEQDLDYG